jgi:uncharacterized repeat protein (TIGR01451 family)
MRTLGLSKLLFTALVALMLFFSPQSYAVNQVVNPGFTGTATAATSWTSSAAGIGAAFNHVISGTAPAAFAAAGITTEFYSGCVGAACLTYPFVVGTSSGAQQTIATTVGTPYSLSFWTYHSGAGTTASPTEIDVYWGATKVYAGINTTPVGWYMQTVYLGVATTTSSVLTVMVRDDPNYSAVTLVDVEPSTPMLRLTKTNPASFIPTVAANYTLTLTNNGSAATSASFTLQDQLPPNFQFNSAAIVSGLTGLTCTSSGTLAAGLLVTCTATNTSGIAAGGTASLTLNVTPQAAAAGVAGTNKASVPYTGTGAGVTPSTCLGNDNPLGCAVAPAITTNNAALLNLTKANPASLVVSVPANYTLTIQNTGNIASAASFTLQDQLPPNIQYNSAATVSGLTGLTCASSGTLAAGLLVTCTVTNTGGIAAGSTASLTINVTPQAASAGVAGTNKASVPYTGTGAGVAPSTCTANNSPAGCAVAASITPAAALLSVAKTATLICDPVNGTSNPKYIPGAVVRWTVTVTNSGLTSVSLATVSDLLNANTTMDANLITGAGGAARCVSATGTPESAAGRGFKLSISGTPVAPATTLRPAAAYPKFFTTTADGDAAGLSGVSVTINYALGLPAEGTAPNAYTAGELKPGEVVTVYFNATIN